LFENLTPRDDLWPLGIGWQKYKIEIEKAGCDFKKK